MRPESIKRKRWVAIPDPHTKWDRITLPAGCTLNAMIETLRAAHGLVVTGWTALVPGDDGKPTGITLYRKEVQVAELDEETYWLARLVHTRDIYLTPMTNSRGYYLSKREENGVVTRAIFKARLSGRRPALRP